MAKRVVVVGGLLLVLVLGTASGLAQGGVALPPAEEEVAALESAFAQITKFFSGFIGDVKGSLAMLGRKVDDLEKATIVFQMGLEGLAQRFRDQAGQLSSLADRVTTIERAIEGSIGPALLNLDRRISALEKYDFASFERRLAALDHAHGALSVRIDNNRSKIEALEAALAATSAGLDERLAVVEEVQVEAATQREEIEALKAELARLAQAQQGQWAAIFLVPLAVGALLFLLLGS